VIQLEGTSEDGCNMIRALAVGAIERAAVAVARYEEESMSERACIP
jgi:hypothetical protein